jgi:hypothetical protein
MNLFQKWWALDRPRPCDSCGIPLYWTRTTDWKMVRGLIGHTPLAFSPVLVLLLASLWPILFFSGWLFALGLLEASSRPFLMKQQHPPSE